MVGGFQQALMLMLAAQVHHRANRCRQLRGAGHAPVKRHARAAIRPHTTRYHQIALARRRLSCAAIAGTSAAGIGTHGAPTRRRIFPRRISIRAFASTFTCAFAHEETPRHHQRVFPIAHHLRAGTLAHKQLARRKQRRFARARLAREHRQPRARRKRGVADKRQILNMDFIDHELRAFLFVALPFAAFFPVSIPVVIP